MSQWQAMEGFVDFAGQSGFHDVSDEGQANGHGHAQFYHATTTSSGDPSKPAYIQQLPCDIKPRLTKEQHDILEAEFQNQHKPNTITKKRFAENLGVSLDKVNVSVIDSEAWR